MAKIAAITEMAQWQKLWEDSKASDAPTVLIFKRSQICPTSHFAEGIFNRYVSGLKDAPDLKIFSVDVIAARPISRQIAADTGIQHESPQALLIKGERKIAWNASHGDIDEDALKQHVPATK